MTMTAREIYYSKYKLRFDSALDDVAYRIVRKYNDKLDYYVRLKQILINKSNDVVVRVAKCFEWECKQEKVEDLSDFILTLTAELSDTLSAKVTLLIKIYSFGMFHRVGQGLMFSANLYTGGAKITCHVSPFSSFNTCIIELDFHKLIYDCGSLSGKNQISIGVSDYIDYSFHDCYSADVDTLYISHFDEDHINGIQILCSKCYVRSIMLSYLPPEEAIINAVSNKPEDEESCRKFLFPTEHIANIGKQRGQVIDLIYLHGDDKHLLGVETDKVPGPENSPWRNTFSFRREMTADVENSEGGGVRVYHAYPNSVRSRASSKALGDRIGAYSAKTSSGNWDLMMFYFVRQYQSLDDYITQLINMLNTTFPDLKLPGLEPLSKQWLSKLAKHICTDEGLKKIKEIYSELPGDENSHSLCLALSPKRTDSAVTEELTFLRNERFMNLSEPFYMYCMKMHHGTLLLTGDSELDNKTSENGDEFYKVISNGLSNENFCPTMIALLPHHGSSNNISWNAITALNATVWTVSYGKDNRYYHPDTYPAGWFKYHSNVQWHNGTDAEKLSNNFPGIKGEYIDNYECPFSDADDNYRLIHCHNNARLMVFMQ